jgi:hypothetical protein
MKSTQLYPITRSPVTIGWGHQQLINALRSTPRPYTETRMSVRDSAGDCTTAGWAEYNDSNVNLKPWISLHISYISLERGNDPKQSLCLHQTVHHTYCDMPPKSRNIEGRKQQRRPLPGNGSIRVVPVATNMLEIKSTCYLQMKTHSRDNADITNTLDTVKSETRGVF